MRMSFATFAATMTVATFVASPASADWLFGNGPRFDGGRWCAVMDTGAERAERDCTIDSIEVCRQMVIAGNRGFCVQNPAYRGYAESPRRYKKRHARS